MKYWPQQPNFAVFCATQGCGISWEIFDSGFSLTQQIRAFHQFHVYFTVRRVLYQLGGFQSMSALPGDPTFNQFNNHYHVASYKRICAEFSIDPSSDFRFIIGKNQLLEPATRAICKTRFSCPMNVGWLKLFIFRTTVMFVWIIILQALQAAQIFTTSITVKYRPLVVIIATALCENQ